MNYDKVPEPLSASYDVASSVMSVTFDEPVRILDEDGFALILSNETLKPQNFSKDVSRIVTAVATLDNITLSDVVILSLNDGAVGDGSKNENLFHNVTVRIYDSEIPSVQSVVYDTVFDILEISFDQTITDADLSLFYVGNVSLHDAHEFETLPGYNVHLALNGSANDAIIERPYLHLGMGAVTGSDGKVSAFAPNNPIHLEMPTNVDSVRSAVYDAISDTLWLDVTGSRITANLQDITLKDIPLSDMRVILNGVLISEGNSTVLPSDDLYLNIPRGSILTKYGILPEIPRIQSQHI